jgi:TonB family protein
MADKETEMIIYALALAAAMQDETAELYPMPPPPPEAYPVAPPPAPLPYVIAPPEKGTASPPVPKDYPGNWVSTDDYPSRSLRMEEQGTTTFLLTISTAGVVTRCTVTSSSGYANLDAATCSNITRRARFYPAQDDKGRVIASTYVNRVTWRIPYDDYPEMPVPYGENVANYPSAPQFVSYASYPKEADQPAGVDWSKAQKTLKLKLEIDASGAIASCEVGKSSHDVILDKASCDYALSQWRYQPARDYEGNPTKGRVERTLYWPTRIANGVEFGNEPPKPRIGRNAFLDTGKVDLILSVDATGKVTNCDAKLQGLNAMMGNDDFRVEEICNVATSSRGLIEPFEDENGNPVARTVVIAFTLDHKPYEAPLAGE